ncbi:uncharacterized protein si:dkey-19f23.1 isoform X3 [Danio rerio]|uniref:Uncharacterized protein si:dkey-19f23.1 isoform X3 n=1 Tax=Danio rerio TaxID=7955 RepID=A0AC58HIR9_DANRE
MCPMLQRLQPACASPDGRSQGGQLGREAAASRAGRRPRGHAEDTVPGPGMSPDASPPRQALEAARGALDLGKERGYGEGETPESSSGVAVAAVHPACNPCRVPASIVLRGGAGLGGPRGRPPVRRPRLQARHRAHTGSAHGPGETGYQDAVHPAPDHTPLPGAEEGRRGEKEEEAGEENQVASCTTGSRARRGRRSDAPRASGGFGTLPVPGPRPRAELSIFQARHCRSAGCVASGKLTLGCARSTDLLLGEFEGYQLGSEPTPRLRNNVTSKLGRIKAFLGYMARGTAEPGDFLFLNQPARIRAWAARLGQTRMAEPTRQHYLKNVAQFLDYLSETPPAACQLSSTALVLIRREVRALIRGIRRRVVVHEVRTKQAKESRLIPKASLVRCHRTAGRKIPALLDSLESNPSTRQQWRFYGFLTGYLTSISGHRCGVFQNLTIQEVEEASRSPDESAYVINITTHKTNRAFGAAQLSLNREEYSWFRRFLALRAGLPGGSQATYFFFTSRASPCRTLNKYFQSAWLSMGLPGKPTFTDVRTAIATHAKNAHSSEDRRKVAQFMCHDTSTSDKFYALHLGPLQARERRRLFERALVEEEEEEEDGEAAGTESPPRKGRKRTETSVSPLEGTSRRTLPWRPAKGKSQGARPLEQTEDSESS